MGSYSEVAGSLLLSREKMPQGLSYLPVKRRVGAYGLAKNRLILDCEVYTYDPDQWTVSSDLSDSNVVCIKLKGFKFCCEPAARASSQPLAQDASASADVARQTSKSDRVPLYQKVASPFPTDTSNPKTLPSRLQCFIAKPCSHHITTRNQHRITTSANSCPRFHRHSRPAAQTSMAAGASRIASSP